MVEFNTSAPMEVKKAVYLLCAAVGLALVGGLVEYWQMPTEITVVGDTTLTLSNLFITILALVANTVFLWLRMNWSRYLFALFFVLGLPSMISSMAKALNAHPMQSLLDLLQLAAEGYALYLLFTPQAREWYESE